MNPKKIGMTLKELRGSKPIDEVANALDIADSTLRMYELGERIPRDDVKIRIAKYYGVPIQDIFYDPDVTEGEQE